jgi:exopolysaccharide production protein ExoQ
MPPPVALLLCTIFVVFLLRLDRKQSSQVSTYMWIPTLWFLSRSSRPLGLWFGGGRGDMESGSPVDRAFLIVLLLCGLWILSRRQPSLANAIQRNRWALILLTIMLISIVWSNIPGISFKRWTREFIAVVMGFVVMSDQRPRQAVQSIIRRSIYILIPFSLVLSKYYPALGVQYAEHSGKRMWVGVASQKNGLAHLCIISLLFLIWTFVRRWKGRDIAINKYQIYAEGFLLFLILWLLAGPDRNLFYSATSTAAIAVGLLAMIGLAFLKKRGIMISAALLMFMAVLIILYGTYTPFAGELRFLDVSSVLGRDETLTGRTIIWSMLLPYAKQNPLQGYGFGGFWTTEMRRSIASHAHNGYLEMILSMGFIGIIVVTFYILAVCRKAHGCLSDDYDWGTLFICYVLMMLVHNIGEPSIQSLTTQLSAVVLLFYFVSSPKIIGQ